MNFDEKQMVVVKKALEDRALEIWMWLTSTEKHADDDVEGAEKDLKETKELIEWIEYVEELDKLAEKFLEKKEK